MRMMAGFQLNTRTGLTSGAPRAVAAGGGGLADWVWRLLLAWLGGGCAVAALITAFDLPVNGAAVLVAVGLFMALFAGVFALRRTSVLALLALSMLWLVCLWRLWDEVELGLLKTVSLMLELFASNSTYSFVDLGAEIGQMAPPLAAERVTLFLLAALFPWAAMFTWSAVKRGGFLLPFLLTVPFAALPLWFYIQPAPAALLGLILYWGTLAFTRLVPKRDRDAAGRVGLWVLPALAVLLAALLGLAPAAEYERPAAMESVRLRAEAWARSVPALLASEDGLGPNLAAGGFLSHDQRRRDFDSLGSARFSGRTALKVRVEDGAREALYLKGYTGGVYTAGGWELLGEEAEAALAAACAPVDPQNLTAYRYAQENPERTVTVRNLANPKVIYVPNWLTTTPRSFALGEFVGDGNIRARGLLGLDEYSLSYIPSSANLLRLRGGDFYLYAENGGDFIMRERPSAEEFGRYQAEVYARYTQVPEELEAVLDPLLSEAGLNRGPIMGQAAAFGVSHLLERLGSYTLTPGSPPEGRDFTEYFLTENRQGFCVHFATAGVLMMRRLGIPARYCEGYLVTPADLRGTGEGGFSDIPDRRSHAWAEYWQDGVGWTTLECTPGFNPQADVIQPNDAGNEAAETPPPTAAPTPEPTTAVPTPPPTPAPTPTPEVTRQPGESGMAAERVQAVLKLLRWPAAAGLVVLGAAARRRAMAERRRRAFAQEDANRAALAIYAEADRLTPYVGEPDGEMTTLAEKARFSRHTLSPDEVDALKAGWSARKRDALEKAGWLRRIWLVWGLGLDRR